MGKKIIPLCPFSDFIHICVKARSRLDGLDIVKLGNVNCGLSYLKAWVQKNLTPSQMAARNIHLHDFDLKDRMNYRAFERISDEIFLELFDAEIDNSNITATVLLLRMLRDSSIGFIDDVAGIL